MLLSAPTPTHFLLARSLSCSPRADLCLPRSPALRRTVHGQTPLHLAISENHRLAVFMLLHHGCNPNTPDENGYRPIHLAVKRHDLRLLNVCHGALSPLSPLSLPPPIRSSSGQPRGLS